MDIAGALAFKELMDVIRGLVPHGGKKDAPPEQQMPADFLPSYDDEALCAALDAALVRVKEAEGLAYLKHIQAVRAKLEPHQRNRWRNVFGTIKLTDRYEDVPSSTKHTKVEASAKGPAKEETTTTTERRQQFYAYTKDDPRLQHLILVAEIARDQGIDGAVKYLIDSDFALKTSLFEQGEEKLESWKKAAGEKLSRASYRVFLGKEYEKIRERNADAPFEETKKLLEKALTEKTARDKRRLTVAKKTRIHHARPIGLILLALATIVMILATAYFELY